MPIMRKVFGSAQEALEYLDWFLTGTLEAVWSHVADSQITREADERMSWHLSAMIDAPFIRPQDWQRFRRGKGWKLSRTEVARRNSRAIDPEPQVFTGGPRGLSRKHKA
jgi:hypothetical protein